MTRLERIDHYGWRIIRGWALSCESSCGANLYVTPRGPACCLKTQAMSFCLNHLHTAQRCAMNARSEAARGWPSGEAGE